MESLGVFDEFAIKVADCLRWEFGAEDHDVATAQTDDSRLKCRLLQTEKSNFPVLSWVPSMSFAAGRVMVHGRKARSLSRRLH